MRKILLIGIICSLPGALANAATVKCEVDKAVLGGKKKPVPLTILKGAENKGPAEIEFEGHTFSAVWHQGDEFERQSSLAMRFGDIVSSMSDFTTKGHTGPINAMSKGHLRFQCWVE